MNKQFDIKQGLAKAINHKNLPRAEMHAVMS